MALTTKPSNIIRPNNGCELQFLLLSDEGLPHYDYPKLVQRQTGMDFLDFSYCSLTSLHRMYTDLQPPLQMASRGTPCLPSINRCQPSLSSARSKRKSWFSEQWGTVEGISINEMRGIVKYMCVCVSPSGCPYIPGYPIQHDCVGTFGDYTVTLCVIRWSAKNLMILGSLTEEATGIVQW